MVSLMLKLDKITFPLYKLRSYISIDTNPLGLVKITTIKGTYILDDTSIPTDFEERRLILAEDYPSEKLYKLKEQVLYLRQLVKYKSGTTFIDYNGKLVEYKKGNNLFKINSHKILNKQEHGNWTVLTLENMEIQFVVGQLLPHTATHASIMETKWGPFLYDLTSIKHLTYSRKL
jgi:hypothetical protein